MLTAFLIGLHWAPLVHSTRLQYAPERIDRGYGGRKVPSAVYSYVVTMANVGRYE